MPQVISLIFLTAYNFQFMQESEIQQINVVCVYCDILNEYHLKNIAQLHVLSYQYECIAGVKKTTVVQTAVIAQVCLRRQLYGARICAVSSLK